MTESADRAHSQVYRNVVTGATPNPVMPVPDAVDEAFATAANGVLGRSVELARALVGAHQAAVAVIVQHDWTSVRKFFSLSEKYAAWADYRTPAVGFGTHAWLLEHPQPVRLTQAELEAHPAWAGFGTEAGKHPPMRGWLAAPIVDRNGVVWGLLQLSDRYDGDFTAEDERVFVQFAELVSSALEALWDVRNLRKG
ncbi:MAG TPA: GAF domain-containing protein [Gemmatirosa sp.]|jgi:GAF domain-containing protein|nr:GAF domain-containing protein [Gemmatirosa sp.]